MKMDRRFVTADDLFFIITAPRGMGDSLTVRYRTPVSEPPNTMGAVNGEIAAHMGKSGIPFAEPPFIVYCSMDIYNTLTVFIKEKGVQTETFMIEECLDSLEDAPPENLETVIYLPSSRSGNSRCGRPRCHGEEA